MTNRPAAPLVLAECELTADQFARIAGMLHEHAGIRMREGKERLVRARLTRRLRRLGLANFEEYLAFIDQDASKAEFAEMVDALTTNKTSFLREAAHFDFLREHVLPALRPSARIWSAGCATGEEAYTLAMLVNEVVPDAVARDLRVFATDISQRVLDLAEAGCYPPEVMADVPPEWLRTYWSRRSVSNSRELLEAAPALRRLVHFERLNLMEPWPMEGPFDVILCRNVMIYFDKETQQRLVERFWAMIRPGGHLLVGHSESLTGLTHRFRYVQPAVYLK
jgi:chemotaxis protein methyltransferase CheR